MTVSKARMQPTAQTGIVWKISIFLFLLLAVVLYKMNDYFKQEKWQLAQNQLRTQIVSLKTSVSSQISSLKNVLSSYEYELSESKINWVQLDPFFGIASAQKIGGRGSTDFAIQQFIARSGSVGEKWTVDYLKKLMSRQVSNSDQPITVEIFQDSQGEKLMAIRFVNNSGRALIAIGGADYFQKYFDLSRGDKVTALLQTSENTMAAHSEADYLGSSMDENALSPKKFLIEKEEIAGTNLVVMNFLNRKSLTKKFAVPWSVVGLIIGFGLLIVALLIYTMDPLERRIEKYKMQEREQIFNETLSQSLSEPASADLLFEKTATDVVMAKLQKQDELAYQQNEPNRQVSPELVTKIEIEENPSVEYNSALSLFQRPLELEPESDLKQVQSTSSVRTGSIVLDMSDLENIDFPVPKNLSPEAHSSPQGSTDHLDLDQVLSLDEFEADQPESKKVEFVKDNLTSKKINSTQQLAEVHKPHFAMKRKEYQVDDFQISVRRPERS